MLNTIEASEILDVAPSTIKRWADSGKLSHTKTAGGHRRFREKDLRRFKDQLEGKESPAERCQNWLDLLLGDADMYKLKGEMMLARSIYESWWKVAEELGSVLYHLGKKWEVGEISVIQEHEVSRKIENLINWVSFDFPEVKNAPICLLCMVEGDFHTLGLNLAEICLKEAGWRVKWSGKSTPHNEILTCVREVQMIGISASSNQNNSEKLKKEYSSIAEECKKQNTHLLLGGSGSWPENPENAYRTKSFSELKKALDEIWKEI